MNGRQPPLGYGVNDRQLSVNEAEADTVRHIMRRYRALGSVRAMQEELHAQTILSKLDKGRGGIPFTPAASITCCGARSTWASCTSS